MESSREPSSPNPDAHSRPIVQGGKSGGTPLRFLLSVHGKALENQALTRKIGGLALRFRDEEAVGSNAMVARSDLGKIPRSAHGHGQRQSRRPDPLWPRNHHCQQGI